MRALLIFLTAAAMAACAPIASADADEIYTSWRDDVAVGGYDIVSFYSGNPVEGRESITYEYKGAVWRFRTRANRDLFRTNPEAFEPQYGGYCAWAVAHDKLAKGDPENWHIQDGRLYLNYNDRIQEKWEKDMSAFITRADENWPAILTD